MTSIGTSLDSPYKVRKGAVDIVDGDRDQWQWRAMIVQPDPVDARAVARAVEQARAKKSLPALDRLRFERWQEGRCAQVLHIGPYTDEGPSTVRLHDGIAAAGYSHMGVTTRSISATPAASRQRSHCVCRD